jgi:hypothetical protein
MWGGSQVQPLLLVMPLIDGITACQDLQKVFFELNM